jgi:hypothetical protein
MYLSIIHYSIVLMDIHHFLLESRLVSLSSLIKTINNIASMISSLHLYLLFWELFI